MTAKFLSAISILLLLCIQPIFSQEPFPVGSNPPSLGVPHFPSKLYAVIWRNWNLVSPERIALTIGATEKQVIEIANEMGLPPARNLAADFNKRIYITVIRRNWHLLPYDQLLTLLNFTKRELEFALKEDDFLFIKLGSLKPACDRIVYKAPDNKIKGQLSEIKKVAQTYFNQGSAEQTELPFAFVKSLEKLPENIQSVKTVDGAPRIVYSYFGIFGDPLIDTIHNPYPEGLLARLSQKGVTGVWMHVVLNQLASGGTDFPEFGEGHEKRIANLNRIVQTAKKYGISVYLYMNEPRAMPLSFFANRKEMMGATEGDFAAMCTANPTVAKWMTESLKYVFTEVPDLGGVFTISASENLTNCASHNNQATCPRCSKRDYADIIADVNAIISKGVHAGNANAKVLVWDWGWHNHGLAKDIIDRLPKDVWLMSVSEWAKEIERGGIKSSIGEYSISAVGPGSRAKQHWAWAKEDGLKIAAKVQFNNTWELSAIPWLPVSNLIAEHAANLAKSGVDGMMLSWSLGGYPSPNLEIAQSFQKNPSSSINDVLKGLAERRYGSKAAPYALQAWTFFSHAFREFPYNINTIYTAPLQYGPSNLLYDSSTGYQATMAGLPYDDVTSWRSIYPPDVFVQQLQKVADGWQKGLQSFQQVVANTEQQQHTIAKGDQGIAMAAWLHFASVANQSLFVIYRDSLSHADEKTGILLKKKLSDILNNEIKLAATLFDVSRKDSRIGFEASNQYYYVAQDLVEKVLNCKYLLNYFDKKGK